MTTGYSGSSRASCLGAALAAGCAAAALASGCSRPARHDGLAVASATPVAAPDAVPSPPSPPSSPPLPRRPRVPIAPVGDTGTGSTLVLVRVAGRTIAFVADEDDRALHAV